MEAYLRKLIRVLGIGAVFASLPLLAALAKLEPPSPPAIAYVSSALVLLASLLAWEFGRGAKRSARRRIILIGVIGCVVGVFAYLTLYVRFVEAIPGGDERVVRGYECTANAKAIYRDDCPDLTKDNIADAGWETKTLWTRNSVANVEIGLVATWMLFICGLIGAVGGIVVGERFNARRSVKTPDRPSG